MGGTQGTGSDLATQALIGLALQVAIVLLLTAWGRAVARKHGGRAWRLAAWMPALGLALGVAGSAIGVLMLQRLWASLQSVATAASRAERLAAGISEAMNVSAMFLVPSFALYAASLVTFLAGTLRRAPADRG